MMNKSGAITSGYLARTTEHRKKADENLITTRVFYKSCWGSGTNPYVYTSYAKAAMANRMQKDESGNYVPTRRTEAIYDHSNRPTYTRAKYPDYEDYAQAVREWRSNAPIIGYYETIDDVVPAQIVEVKHDDKT